MTPRVLGQSAAQLSILVTAVLTARLALGAERLTGLDYAYQLMLLPYGVFSLSLSTVAFPRLARLFAEDDRQTLQASIRSTFRTILFLTLPSAAALMLLAVPVVRFIFQRYEFDEVALVYTVVPLLGYATALPAFAISEILIRTFYAMQQTWVPVLVGLLQVLLNLALGSLALLLGGGVGMLALAFSIANNVESLLLFVLLRRRLPDIWRERALWRSVRASLAATALLAGLLTGWQMLAQSFLPFLALNGAYQWQQDIGVLAGWLAATGLAGVALYMAAAAAAGSHDARLALNRAVSIIQQRWHARR
jgi:putative peptidoglycan lipid II flippase